MIDQMLQKLDFKKGNGLVPVVIQDVRTLDVLTLAYVDKDAFQMTVTTGFAHYFRRSKKRVMKKGITSGNVQKVIRIITDCDQDALLFQVTQVGDACHLGKTSCFHFLLKEEILE